jgi:hypothetical protein
MGVEIRLKFNPRTGEILRDKTGQPKVVEVLTPPEMEPCSMCYQLKIPRATVMAQKAAGQRIHKCEDCRLNGKLPVKGKG